MPEAPYRLLTSPVRLTGRPHLAHLVTLVSADTLARRARSEGRDPHWEAASLAGDLGVQAQVEAELARQGQSRAELGREAFVERVRAFEAAGRRAAAEQLAAVGVDVDLEAGALDAPAPARAARTAFVRLYEAGLLTREDRVVASCARCGTVVDPADAETGGVEGEELVLRLPLTDGDGVLAISTSAPELLPGVVAVAVAEDDPAAGHSVSLPVADATVPVVPDAGCTAPEFVVPAHDPVALELSRRLGLPPVPVLDGDGVVRAPGPLDGLPRYGARAAAAERLAAAGVVTATSPLTDPVRRCRRCGTILVPRLGRHWFLPMADLEVAVADAVREGHLTFAPPLAAEALLERAGMGGDWCVSHQVWAGQRVPVSSCVDCGQLDVAVEDRVSCGKCMGDLRPDDDVLDARFVAAVWPLAARGWPDADDGPTEAAADTTLLVGPLGVGRWALPMGALGLKLAGRVPFAHVAVLDVNADPDDPDPRLPVGLEHYVDAHGPRVVRCALVAGGLDMASADSLAAGVADPSDGDTDVDALAEACSAAYAAGTPGAAVALLAAAVQAGVKPEAADRVRALAAPILGD